MTSQIYAAFRRHAAACGPIRRSVEPFHAHTSTGNDTAFRLAAAGAADVVKCDQLCGPAVDHQSADSAARRSAVAAEQPAESVAGRLCVLRRVFRGGLVPGDAGRSLASAALDCDGAFGLERHDGGQRPGPELPPVGTGPRVCGDRRGDADARRRGHAGGRVPSPAAFAGDRFVLSRYPAGGQPEPDRRQLAVADSVDRLARLLCRTGLGRHCDGFRDDAGQGSAPRRDRGSGQTFASAN